MDQRSDRPTQRVTLIDYRVMCTQLKGELTLTDGIKGGLTNEIKFLMLPWMGLAEGLAQIPFPEK